MKPAYAIYRGFRLPASFTLEAFSSALDYAAAPGDIFVTTYPKCGTTWVQHIVYLLLNDGTPLGADEKLDDVSPFLEEAGGGVVQAMPPPRLIKTHLPFEMTPHHEEARYIYVARNPFDCAVSFYHHTRGFPAHYDFADGTFDEYFECFVAGEVDFGDYFDNLASWYEHRNDANVLFLTYEAMRHNPEEAIRTIAVFLAIPADDGLVESVLEYSRFERMRENQDRWSSRRPNGMPGFIRKGVVGDWKSQFSPGQVRRLLEKSSARAEGSKLESLWPDIMADARIVAG